MSINLQNILLSKMPKWLHSSSFIFIAQFRIQFIASIGGLVRLYSIIESVRLVEC